MNKSQSKSQLIALTKGQGSCPKGKLITWAIRRHGAGRGPSREMAELNRLAKIECLRRAATRQAKNGNRD